MRRFMQNNWPGLALSAFVLTAAFAVGPAATEKAAAQTTPIVKTNSAGDQLVAGTNTLSVTAEPLTSSDVVWECLVQNDPDNSDDIYVGDSSTQSIHLEPGDSIVVPIADSSTIYVVADANTPTANYLCR